MSKEFAYRTERDWPNKRLKTGAIVGHTTDTSCRLWLRTGRLGKFTLICYPMPTDGAGKDFFDGFRKVPYDLSALPPAVITAWISAKDFNSDTTEVVELTGLAPDTEYCYALCGHDEASGKPRIVLGHDRRHTFRTMPAEAKDFSFAFYSCHMPFEEDVFKNIEHSKKKVMWQYFGETLKRHKSKGLRFVMGGGDQVYTDGIRNEKINIIQRLNSEARKEGNRLLPGREEMVLWYRDIYRGYWGLAGVRSVLSSYPTYMIWDDHELWDGWGSYLLKENSDDDELHRMFPVYKDPVEMRKRGLKRADLLKLKDRMFEAAKKVYTEYQHSHNPRTRPGVYDYSFDVGPDSAFYVLDGRGQRDVNRDEDRILGSAQLTRFNRWLDSPRVRDKRFLFITSAVPVVHLKTMIANMAERAPAMWAGLQDDLRDSWENDHHTDEREKLMEALFRAADRGQRVVILSGDVHIAAAFKITNGESVIHQLTSSAITYNIPLWESYLFSLFGVPDDGMIDGKYGFKRLALYGGSNYSLIKVATSGGKDKAEFQLYGGRSVLAPSDLPEDARGAGIFEKLKGFVSGKGAVTHSIAKIALDFEPFDAG